MKMGAGLFWGILLILIGLGVVIRVVFNVHFPIVKFVIAFFFIFIGIKLLIGNFNFFNGHSDGETTIFSESKIYASDKDYKEYNVIFGGSVIDMRDVDLSKGSKEIKINTIFAGSLLKINKETPYKVKADAAFANADLPNGNTAAFGTAKYKSETYAKDTNYLYIKVDVVFGDFKVRTY
ncbi:MAG: hypothetical protein JEY96_10145 [Bacteroidales bacterium]|nr:hypothetical protein [Bacteroidales bacterium]